MKTKILIGVIALVSTITFASCSKNDKKQTSSTTPVVETPESEANITLTAGGETFTINGSCGWAVAGGVNYIGAQDASISARAFSANFSIDELPSQTTTYTIIQSDINDTDPTHVSISLSEINGNTLTSWISSNASGTFTMVVTGNKVTVDLSGIVLQPELSTGFFTSGNVGPFSNAGTLSGTLTFYK